MSDHPAIARAGAFCEALSLRVPILMAPMAGACPASLAVAVANAGGLGGCGALLMQPDAIGAWASDVRAGSNGGFQLNLWIPDPTPNRDTAAEDAVQHSFTLRGKVGQPDHRSYHQLWGFIRIIS
jgi:nitronate monooxygenase